MKKLSLLSVFLLAFCLLSGCDNSSNENELKPVAESKIIEENLNTETIEKNNGILDLYQAEGKITCNIESYDESLGNITSVIYIDGEKVYQELQAGEGENSMKLYGLLLDGNNYSWGDLYGEGNGFIVAEEQTIEEMLSTYDLESEDENTNINCIAGIEGANFEIPNDVEFVDLNSYTDAASYTE